MKRQLLFLFLIVCIASCKKVEQVRMENAYDTSHTENWMQDLLKHFPNKTIRLKDICMPAAHDAGVYELNNCIGGNDCNTQTQNKDMKAMLKSGIRVFDLRPSLVTDTFWTYHKTACDGLGCDGVQLKTLLEQTKTYLETHNELVILELSHFCNTNAQDVALLNLLNETLGNTIYKENGPSSEAFINRPLQSIVNKTTKGKAVLLFEGLSVENRAEGYFNNSFLDMKGSYANSYDLQAMIIDQSIKFSSFLDNNTSLFRMSWTLTLDAGLSIKCVNGTENPISIESLSQDAEEILESTLSSWIDDAIIQKNKIPNIISVDYASTSVTEQCIRISTFNLE